MMQGDSYRLGFEVLNNAGTAVTPEDIIDMEITIGHLRKTYLNAQITYFEGIWMFPLSQEETMDFWPRQVKSQIRIVWANGVVEGKAIHGVRVSESISKEVL